VLSVSSYIGSVVVQNFRVCTHAQGMFDPVGSVGGSVGYRPMDSLTLFGLFAVTAMMLCYALESRSHWFVLAFAGTCVLASTYGFLQGAWPFGVVEGVWSLVALQRWWHGRRRLQKS
jgi:hypothetical protein